MKRVPRDRIDGVLLLDKPLGLSSNDALVRARRLLNAEKAGHGGTLDPMATGLLPVLLGEATKFAHGLLDADKVYTADLMLGETTVGGDLEGEVIERRPVRCDEAAIRRACAAFVGPIEQVPPMHSAIKRDGRPLYELARAGVEVARAARTVTIHSIEVLSIALPRVSLRVHCSKGTYIRTLAQDIGERLDCGAHLAGLRREVVGLLTLTSPLRVEAAHALGPLDGLTVAHRHACLLPFDMLLGHLPRVELAAPEAARFRNGQRLRIAPRSDGDAASLAGAHSPGDAAHAPVTVSVYAEGSLIGVATLSDGLLAPSRLVGSTGASPSPKPPTAVPMPRQTSLERST